MESVDNKMVTYPERNKGNSLYDTSPVVPEIPPIVVAYERTPPTPVPISRLDSPIDARLLLTQAYAVSEGTNRVLLVVYVEESTTGWIGVSSMDYGGQALTQVPSSQIDTLGGGLNNGIEVWYLLDAGIVAAADTTVTMVLNGSPNDYAMGPVSFEGIDQTGGVTSFPDVQTWSNGSTANGSATVTVSEAPGDAIYVATTTGKNSMTATWSANAVEQLDENLGNFSRHHADRLSDSSDNQVITATFDNTNRAAIVGVRMAEA